MTLSCRELARLVRAGNSGDQQGLSVIPSPDVNELDQSGEAAISLRLGRWFLSMKQTSEPFLDVVSSAEQEVVESRIVKRHFVPLGEHFVIHPGRFVLGSTLEWIRLPMNLSGYVAGKSSWGRRGIVIETAAGVHPAFSGCLTLEITNLGEIPVRLRPGMQICQLFVHAVSGELVNSRTSLAGRRRPVLGHVKSDKVFERLRKRP